MLSKTLKQLKTEQEVKETVENNENLMICCGRIGPMCIPVYRIMEELENAYAHVKFCVQKFDTPSANFVRNLPECASFMGLPFTVYFKKGKVVAATSSIQNKDQIVKILDKHFG